MLARNSQRAERNMRSNRPSLNVHVVAHRCRGRNVSTSGGRALCSDHSGILNCRDAAEALFPFCKRRALFVEEIVAIVNLVEFVPAGPGYMVQ